MNGAAVASRGMERTMNRVNKPVSLAGRTIRYCCRACAFFDTRKKGYAAGCTYDLSRFGAAGAPAGVAPNAPE